jgi:TP901 family phage tail tape measure protein
MSEPFAEATVRIRPDTRGFARDLRAQLKAAIETVETTRPPKIRIGPALTRNFVGDLRTQANAAVRRAERGVKPLVIRSTVIELSQRAVRDLTTRAQAQVNRSGIRIPGAAAAAPGGGGARAQDATQAALGLASAQKILNSRFAEGAVDLSVYTKEIEKSATVRQRLVGVSAQDVAATRQAAEATALLARAKRALAAVSEFEVGTAARATAIRNAESKAVQATIVARELGNDELRKEAQALRTQLRGLQGATTALGEHDAATNRTARAHAQLRRGVLATSLSFLGIRGATLAASAQFLAGAAAISIFAKALQSSSRFADQINVFRATSQATAEELQRVRDTARALGADISLPGVTAADAAESMTELAKAGLDVQQSIEGARGVLQLATAAAITNAQAVELAANALNAFQLTGRDATRVADVFANAANAAQGSIVDIGVAFQQSAAAGRQVGLSFEDTAAFLTVLAKNGLRGSDAGTSLRTALIRLIRPTDAAKERIKELGLVIRDAQGNLRPDIFIQIAEATRELSPAMRDATIAMLGGQDAFRAISILGRQSIEEFIALRRELREQGTAAELAAARTEGLRGSIEAFSNVLSTAGTRVGQGMTPALQDIVGGLTATVTAMSESENVANTFAGTMDFVRTAIAALGQTLQTVVPLIAELGVFGSTANFIGVQNILLAVAAYKLLPPILTRTSAALFNVRTAAVAAAFAMRPATFAAASMRIAFTSLVTALPLFQIGVAAAATGLFLLLTRESAVERATKSLTKELDDLVTVMNEVNSTRTTAETSGLSVNAAELSVLEARQAAAIARGNVNRTTAAKGSIAYKIAQLELAVALDNVSIAEQRASEAAVQASQDRAAAQAALAKVTRERQEAIDSIVRFIEVSREAAFNQVNNARAGEPEAVLAAEAKAREKVIQRLSEEAAASRESSDAAERSLGRRKDLLIELISVMENAPTRFEIGVVFDPRNTLSEAARLMQERLRNAGDSAAAAAVESILLKLGILPPRLKTYMDGPVRAALIAGFSSGGDDAGTAGANSLLQSFITTLRRGQGRLKSLDIQEDLAVIASGETGSTLPVLQTRLAELNKQRAAVQAAIAKGGITPSLREERTRIIGDQRATIESIRQINEQLANEADAARADAERKREEEDEKADQAALNRLQRRRSRREDRVADASLTESLSDDINANVALRNLIRRQINQIKEVVKDRQAQIQAIVALQGVETALTREILSLQQQRQQQIQDRIAERNQLDIEHASITENEAAEIRARRREIQRLRKLQDETKEGTVEYKRLRNLIAQQQKAIKDLQDEGKGADGGTTAFELLQQNSETFARISGDLTNFNQPFGEASDFTVDLAALLTRRPQAKPEIVVKHKRDREVTSMDRLVEALNRNTNALTGKPDPKNPQSAKKGKSGATGDRDNRWREAGANRRKMHGYV